MPLSRLLCALTAAVSLGCSPSDPDAEDDGDSGATDDVQPTRTPPEPPAYSAGSCPVLEDGRQAFVTGDTSYDVRVKLPADPQGAPVVFAWHWLGGNSSSIINGLELDDLVEQENVIVIAPDSDGSTFEWHFLDAPEGNPDLLLFEDLLACAIEQWDIDRTRVYATGMSAGGLQTSYLTVYASQWLAATAPLSGGVDAYVSPDSPVPVMLTWGGPRDLYATFSFEEASLALSAGLVSDGHFVIECVHDDGHTLPPWGFDYLWDFFEAHPMGVNPEPWAEALPEGYPESCQLAGAE